MTKGAIKMPTPSEKRPGDIRATKSLIEKKEERLYFLGPPKYPQGLNEITNLAPGRTTQKALIMEALDDLFKKYAGGDGRHEIPDLPELQRRLENLDCIG